MQKSGDTQLLKLNAGMRRAHPEILAEGLSDNLSKEDNFTKRDTTGGGSHGRSRGTWLDLNVAHVTPLDYEDPLTLINSNNDNSKSMEMSECGSTTGSFEEKDPMSAWKEMKQNSFTSNTYSRLPPPVPKRRGRKTKSEMMQQKLEMAKKERVDRFARIAAPSGLFNELNPGIINHVRNSKQVHSIIEALVKSESIETGDLSIKPASKIINFSSEEMKEPPCQNHGNLVGLECASTRNRHVTGCSIASTLVPLGVKEECFDFCSSQTDSKMQYISSHSLHGRKDDSLSLKMSSSPTANGSEGITSITSDDNVTGVSVLTVKAATVASQWLDLLHKDAKGRLAALRQSRKRARSVMETDLPSLLAKEFPSTISDDRSTLVSMFPKNDAAELHQTRWGSLFSHMEVALSEEEKQLEEWISQVKEMQLHCEAGLQNEPWNSLFRQQKLRTPGDSFRAESTSNEKNFAVTAAAASIYSTSFILNRDEGNT